MNVLKKFLKSFPKKRRSRFLLILASISVVLLPLFLNSCGDDYKSASERDPKVNVLISASDLKYWVDNGYEKDKYGQNKVVVLHVGSGYDSGHVPGAFEVNLTDIKDPKNGNNPRSDGVSEIESAAALKGNLDRLIQNTGIDGGAVIVLTSVEASFEALSGIYFNLRYWGFPRSKLRVLDGFVDTTWTYPLDLADPKPPEATEYSVCNLTQEPDRFRAPLEEMINVAADNDPKTAIIDTRSNADEYNGVDGATTAQSVAFEGHIRTALWQASSQLTDVAGDGRFLGIAELKQLFSASALGLLVDDTTTSYIYSSDGWSATLTFLALDGILNYPVKLYDGGWLEWGQMAGGGGYLDADSKWRTDGSLSAVVTYNTTATALSSYSFVDSNAANANAVNEEDRVTCFEGGGGDAGGY